MRRVIVLVTMLVSCLSAGGCDSDTECEQICRGLRDTLIHDFSVPAEDINCEDAKWEGSCEHCHDILLADYGILIEESCEESRRGPDGGS